MTARKAVPPADMPDFASLLAGAKLPERSVPICMRADLVADHEAADRELEALLDAPTGKFNDGRGELKERILRLEAEMKAATYTFRLRALPGAAFRKLVAEHPPRRTDDGGVDQRDAIGVDISTMFNALVQVCVIDPAMTDDQLERLQEALTDKQWDLLATAAWNLNTRAVDVPFSRAASLLSQDSVPG